MLHRRLLYDDRRGVAEPLNETACGCRNCHCDGLIVRGTHLLTFEVRRTYHICRCCNGFPCLVGGAQFLGSVAVRCPTSA